MKLGVQYSVSEMEDGVTHMLVDAHVPHTHVHYRKEGVVLIVTEYKVITILSVPLIHQHIVLQVLRCGLEA